MTPWTKPTRLVCPWDFPGKNTGVVRHLLLHRIFPTKGSNPHLLHGRADSWPSVPSGKPFIVATKNSSILIHHLLFPAQFYRYHSKIVAAKQAYRKCVYGCEQKWEEWFWLSAASCCTIKYTFKMLWKYNMFLCNTFVDKWIESCLTPSLVDLGIARWIAPRHRGRATESWMV